MAPTLRSFFVVALAAVARATPAVACEQPGSAACASLPLRAVYKGEAWRNLKGGIETGGDYLDNLDLIADLDANRWPGLGGLKLHAHVIYNNGHVFGARYVGERQALSNIEGVSTWRLYEIWADYSFGTKLSNSVRFGLYDFNTEFNALDVSALFINSSHGTGAELAQSGLNGPSIFPVTGLALRVRGSTEKFYWQFAALDGVPGEPDHPDRTGLHLDRAEGVLLAAEFGGAIAGFSKLALGGWRYAAHFDSIDEASSSGDPVRARGNQGFYLLAERPFWSQGNSSISGFLRAGSAETRFNQLSDFVGTGIVMQGFSAARPDDALGFAIAHASNGHRFRQFAVRNGTPVERSETVLELTWRAPVTEWLTLQPSLQYVVNPGMDPQLGNAWALGLRFELSASRAR
jgi:porin